MTGVRAAPDVLKTFGLGAADLIGEGGESRVYALGGDRVLRVPRGAWTGGTVNRRRLKAFLQRIAGRLPFATPTILEIGPEGAWTIERRLPGKPLSALLRSLDGADRETALRNYSEGVAALGKIALPYVPYGHILAPDPVRASDWRTFARQSLAGFRDRNRAAIAQAVGDPDALFAEAVKMIAALPERPEKVLVHGDYFPGNVLMDQQLAVSAVLDFGVFTVAGDRQLDRAVACHTLELLEECRPEDAGVVHAAMVERYGAAIEPAFRFYRTYLAFSMADPANAAPPYPRLYDWSLDQLTRLATGRLPP